MVEHNHISRSIKKRDCKSSSFASIYLDCYLNLSFYLYVFIHSETPKAVYVIRFKNQNYIIMRSEYTPMTQITFYTLIEVNWFCTIYMGSLFTDNSLKSKAYDWLISNI